MAITLVSPALESELRSAGTHIVKPKGSTLFRTGQPVKGAFLIHSGRVRMSLDHSALYPARTLGSGRIIGLPATFSGEPYSLTATAEQNCHLYFIPRARLLEILRRKPEVGFQIVRMLSEEISQMRKAAIHESMRATYGDSGNELTAQKTL